MKIEILVFTFFSTVFLIYLLLPAPEFPPPLPNSTQSPEPADLAFPLRPAYFTISNRQQTLEHYENYFSLLFLKGIHLPSFRLSYPPEDSSHLVRQHVQSSYLEEIIYPFRESLFINGFRPTEAKDEIFHAGKHFEEKVIVKYIPSPLLVRIILGLSTLGVLTVILSQLTQLFKELVKTPTLR